MSFNVKSITSVYSRFGGVTVKSIAPPMQRILPTKNIAVSMNGCKEKVEREN